MTDLKKYTDYLLKEIRQELTVNRKHNDESQNDERAQHHFVIPNSLPVKRARKLRISPGSLRLEAGRNLECGGNGADRADQGCEGHQQGHDGADDRNNRTQSILSFPNGFSQFVAHGRFFRDLLLLFANHFRHRGLAPGRFLPDDRKVLSILRSNGFDSIQMVSTDLCFGEAHRSLP